LAQEIPVERFDATCKLRAIVVRPKRLDAEWTGHCDDAIKRA
jgi:hypothetical protein